MQSSWKAKGQKNLAAWPEKNIEWTTEKICKFKWEDEISVFSILYPDFSGFTCYFT